MQQTIEDRARDILVERLGVAPDDVLLTSRFQPDTDKGERHSQAGQGHLGCDSLDIVELTMAFEEEFAVQIGDDEAERLATFGDAVDLLSAKVGQ
jgi:acyl carrier protein